MAEIISDRVKYQDLRDASLFKGVSDEALIELATHCQYMELMAGEFLFHQGDPGDALYILHDGQVHIVRRYPSGEEVVLATEGPYYAIGDLSMLSGQARTGGVLAVSDCTLIALSRDDFLEVSTRIPEIAIQVKQNLSNRLYRMNLLVREYAIGNVAARVASVVMLLSGDKNGVVPGAVRTNRLARAVAIDADAVERIFQEWERQGYIAFDGRTLTIHNIEALDNIAG
jgi:CRP-like cAMP-binding protein